MVLIDRGRQDNQPKMSFIRMKFHTVEPQCVHAFMHVHGEVKIQINFVKLIKTPTVIADYIEYIGVSRRTTVLVNSVLV